MAAATTVDADVVKHCRVELFSMNSGYGASKSQVGVRLPVGRVESSQSRRMLASGTVLLVLLELPGALTPAPCCQRDVGVTFPDVPVSRLRRTP